MQYFGFDRPSFGIKTFGFGVSNSKISADFTTGTYKVDGEDKTFADLFTFTRAGKAWLVKETGLQEYAADVPRLDEGLLIEQSATNIFTHSLLELGGNSFSTKGGNYTVTPDDFLAIGSKVTLNRGAPTGYIYNTSADNIEARSIFSLFVSKSNLSSDILLTSIPSPSPLPAYDAAAVGQGESIAKQNTRKDNLYRFVSTTAIKAGYGRGLIRYDTQNTRAGDVVLHALQFEIGNVASSLIRTGGTPVTRPADYLLNNITGTTVTGDWDSTLNLSIVNGELVHSGYGRIRSLEIN